MNTKAKRKPKPLIPPMPHVFTSGQVAKVLGVSPRTAAQHIDSGRLKGWKIAASRDRRVAIKDLIAFIKSEGSSLERLKCFLRDRGHSMVGLDQHAVFVGFGSHAQDRFRETITGYDCNFCDGVFAAALRLLTLFPSIVVVDLSIGVSEARELAKSVLTEEGHDDTTLIAVCAEDEAELLTDTLTTAGYHAVVARPLDFDLIARRIATNTVKGRK